MRRYETLTPDDVLRICDEWADLSAKDPDWCKAEYNEADDNWICPGCLICDDCLREWLEEEVTADPVMHPTWGRCWYSKTFIMEQLDTIEARENPLTFGSGIGRTREVLDMVLADTPEEIAYTSAAKWYTEEEKA